MRINEINQKIASAGSTGEARGKNNGKPVEEELYFSDSLHRSMCQDGTAENELKKENMSAVTAAETAVETAVTKKKQVLEKDFKRNIADSIIAHIRRNIEVPVAGEVPVRHIPYEECDRIEINILDGYTLKAKLEKEAGGSGNYDGRIYVEMKNDDGESKAYLFNAAGMGAESKDVMERMAWLAYEAGLQR